MQLGFVSAIVPDLSLEQVADLAVAQRYDCVELMCWPTGKAERRYAGVTHVDVSEFAPVDAARVRNVMVQRGVAISGLGYYPNPLSADRAESERAVEHLRKVIAAAALLEVGVVNTFVGRDPRKSVDENWPRFLEVWPPLVRLAEERGVRIGIENCPMYFTGDEWPSGKNLAVSPAIWRRMFAAIPSASFGLNYDPSHMVWQQMDYLKPIREFADRLVHVHAKDVRVDRERIDDVGILATPHEYHRPKLPGLGDIDWGRFFSVLGDSGYNGPVCVEVEDRAYEQTPERRVAALRQTATYLRNFLR
ncbi:MAG TPA: sugar phosphate isomerase/epimerase [Pirellulales bacterium]|jgi:sugar phosphate isomerase/epimerase|nr:sugar phosphate isomerase/epimerase [Pirellulales bacterium]